MGFKLVSVVLMLGLVLSGPLAPLAWAQEKTEGQMAPAKKDDRAWEIGAVVVNTWHVPGKAILCGLGAVSGVAVLLLTFGSGYGAAGRVWQEGCAGHDHRGGDPRDRRRSQRAAEQDDRRANAHPLRHPEGDAERRCDGANCPLVTAFFVA